MDTTFWAGIVIAAVVSVPLSIFANLYSENVRTAIAKWRGVRLARQEAREAQRYKFVTALRAGDGWANSTFVIEATRPIRLMVWVLLGFIEVLSIVAFADRINERVPELAAWGVSVVVAVGTVFFMISAIFAEFRSANIQAKVDRFEDYELSVRKKWGANAIERWRGEL